MRKLRVRLVAVAAGIALGGGLVAGLDSRGYDQCVPVNDDSGVTGQPLLDFSAGCVQ